MPRERRSSGWSGADEPAERPEGLCRAEGAHGSCALRATIGRLCPWHYHVTTMDVLAWGMLPEDRRYAEFVLWRRAEIEAGDTRWERRDAGEWWGRINGLVR